MMTDCYGLGIYAIGVPAALHLARPAPATAAGHEQRRESWIAASPFCRPGNTL
jgi:hypothetical protein